MKVSIGVDFVRSVLQKGRYTFTRAEAETTLARKGANLNAILSRLRKSGWILPLAKDFFIALDAQHQGIGVLPPEWFVDDLARHYNMHYYVGGLTAALLHGASHQKPQVFHVVADRQLPAINRPKLKILFLHKRSVTEEMSEQKKSPAGFFRVSTPEVTAYDVVVYRRACPSLSHAATVLGELGECIDSARLGRLVEMGGEIAALQRLGWLLDRVGWGAKTDQLHLALASARSIWRPLRNGHALDGTRDARWRIVVNEEIEPDVEAIPTAAASEAMNE